MLKTVTLQEANGLLPLVREHFWRLHILLAHLHQLRSQSHNGGLRKIALDRRAALIKVTRKLSKQKKLKVSLKEIHEVELLVEMEISSLMRLGAVVKGLFPVHIDFLSMKNNEPIFLCWHGGEEEIEHWHQLDDGSPLRLDIAKESFGPHVVH